MKLSWKRLQAQKGQAPPVNWRRGPNGAIPVTPKAVRRQRLGTAAMAANRGSEKMNRLLRSAFVSVLEMLALVAISVLFGRFLYSLYVGASVGRATLQSVLAAVTVVIWLNLTHNRYRNDTRRAIADERDLQLRSSTHDQVGGADTKEPPDRTARLDRVDPTRPKTTFSEDFDQRPDWDQPV
jgi:hypothetical protein